MSQLSLFPEAGESSALISADGVYRYWLKRPGQRKPHQWLVWCMLNPSTAGVTLDDPTIRLVRWFSEEWEGMGCMVVNLYGLRATDPADLWLHPDPVGPGNDQVLRDIVATPKTIIMCAWGANAKPDRVAVVREIFAAGAAQLFCLGRNKNGSPKHPLYQPRSARPIPYEIAA